MIDKVLTLLYLPGIGKATLRKLYEANMLDRSINEILYVIKTAFKSKKFRNDYSVDEISFASCQAQEIIAYCQKQNIKIITVFDDDYPISIRQMPDYPIILFTKGNKNILSQVKNVAIIGTRNPSASGVEAAQYASRWFTEHGYVVTSGLAIGCDTEAHKECIKNHGLTIAVLATGLDEIYPKENVKLAEEIIGNNGCLLSEYPPLVTKLNKGNFVERDRLQSALAHGIIVIETEIGGGTMHAVNYGLRQTKPIGCIEYSPGQNSKQEGNLELIKSRNAYSLNSDRDFEMFDNLICCNLPCSTLQKKGEFISLGDRQMSMFDK